MKLQIAVEGKTYEIEVEVVEDDAFPRHPNYGPYTPIPATVQSTPLPSSATPPAASEANVEEAKVCRSPVAGLVIKVNVQAGQEIKTDDLIMVLEAMKMETNITAHTPGKIAKILVAVGEAVKPGQAIAEFV